MCSRDFKTLVLACISLVLLLLPVGAWAHCDGLDGPVVKAAKSALETGNVNLALIWVQKNDEAAIRDAFQKTLNVRKLGAEAKTLADMYFYETLVRIHRKGEGAPYSGLKPAGRDLGPAIPAADRAIEMEDGTPLLKLLEEDVRYGVLEHFKEAIERKRFDKNDVEQGREYVKAYVEFIHYVERIHEAAKKASHGHFPEAEEAKGH